MEYNTNTERYIPTKEEFVALLEGARMEQCDGCGQTYPYTEDYFYLMDDKLSLCVQCQPKGVYVKDVFGCHGCGDEVHVSQSNHNYYCPSCNKENNVEISPILNNMTIKELVECAKVRGIEVKKSWKKAQIIETIQSSGWSEKRAAELMPNVYDHRLYHNETGVQVLGEEDLVGPEAEVAEIKDRLQRVINTFARQTMPSTYRRVAQQARAHKNTRIYPNTQHDWIVKGWGIIETARSMNRAYARGER